MVTAVTVTIRCRAVKMPSTTRSDRRYGGITMPTITRTKHLYDPCKASERPLEGIVTNVPPILQSQR